MAITVEYPVSRPSRLPGEDEADDTSWARHTELIPLGSLRLGPYETQDVALNDAFGLLPLPLPFCSIRIQHSGPPGSGVGEVSSVERGGDLVIDSHVANEGDGWAGSGGNPWRLDEETESFLFLTNMGEKSAEIRFQVQAVGIHYYLTDLRLKPHETRAIDIRKLRDAQKPDFQGNVIPAEASDGSVLWIRMDNVPVMGRMVVLKRGRRMASNYDCGSCPCPPNHQTLGVSCSTGTLLASESEQYTATQTKIDCNYVLYPSNVTGSDNWSSPYPSIATVNNTTQKGRVTGQSGGSTAIIAGITTSTYYYVPYRGCQSCVLTPSAAEDCNVTKLTCGPSSGTQDAVTRGASVYCALTSVPSGAGFSAINPAGFRLPRPFRG